jgi:PBP superfamily domain
MRPSTRIKLGLASASALAFVAGLVVLPANADYAPSGSDVVGVGGETPQFDLDFGADGDTSGDLGYNAANNPNKLVSIDATADSNARAAYLNGSTLAAPKALNGTVVLRAGASPIQRPQSTGAGIKAILADTGKPEIINFVRSGRLPTTAEQTTAVNNGWGGLHVVQIGKDSLQIAVDNTTNAPTGLSIAELLGIYTGTYTKWNQLPGNAGGSTDTIIPLRAPDSSVIWTTLLADLTTANGGVAPVLSASVKVVEQNDPTAITSASTPADAIVAFSSARLNLWKSGYFHEPSTAFPGGAVLAPGIKLLSAVAPDAAKAYDTEVDHYILFRQSDLGSKTPWQPGSTKNWAQTLFSGTSPFFKKAAGKALVAAAGATPVYSDLGVTHS